MARSFTSFNATTAPTLPGGAEDTEMKPVPGLVLVWAPPNTLLDDRAAVCSELVVGRGSSCGWCIRDNRLSRLHFSVSPAAPEGLEIRDLGSRNGVFVNGQRLGERQTIPPDTVVRAGSCVFVSVGDLLSLAPPGRSDPAMAGTFHAPTILKQLRVAARTGHHVLLEGESGVGKELAARALHRYSLELGRDGEMFTHNSACFAGQDDAVATLFGVVPGAFSGVGARKGALELADGGTFFLDEVHALPLRVQRSLLRFVEDSLFQPLGQPAPTRKKLIDIRLIFGTNLSVEQACADGQLAHDLVARLYRVRLPALRERRADIPSIFDQVLRSNLGEDAASLISDTLTARTVERLCLHDFKEANVRELVKMANIMAAFIAEGEPASQAVVSTLDQSFGSSPAPREAPGPGKLDRAASIYERHREEILQAYRDLGGNLSRMESVLRERGIPCTRRWLAEYLAKWGVRPIPKRK